MKRLNIKMQCAYRVSLYLNKAAVKDIFSDKWGNLNMDVVLIDIRELGY